MTRKTGVPAGNRRETARNETVMTNDERATAQRLGHGLPRLLTEDPDRLNDLLGLNRRERRFMASLVPSRVRADVRERLRNRAEPEKPGEEERLLVQWHYGSPDWRTDAWRDALREPGSGPPSQVDPHGRNERESPAPVVLLST